VSDRATRDRGAAEALGLVLIAPVAIGLALLVVSLGRGVDARAQVRTAAESAAQAAALERDPVSAVRAARSVTAAMLTDVDACARPEVLVDTSRFRPGGEVAVTVVCTVGDRGIEVVQSGAREERATAYATIDPFRAAVGP
jgi:Flp pilus assembly protein TadG